MTGVESVIKIAKSEVGYLEKRSADALDSKTINAGDANYTKYARDVYPSLQGQPWCDMFVDWCFVQAFGKTTAKQLLCGGFSAYTPTSSQYYKNRGQYHKSNPQRGDQIFFRNSQRICHTGLVVGVSGGRVYTIEGNTSNGSEVVANGGAVCEKSYALSNSWIDGYGRPDWSIVDNKKYTVGWYHDSTGWWYADTESTYLKSCWKVINKHKYYFNDDGYAVTGWQELESGKWYYFEPRSGHPYECALYLTDGTGAQDVGVF